MEIYMIRYTPWKWLLIDAANHFGKEKLRFEERIEWAEQHLHELHTQAMTDQANAKTRPLYIKAVGAIRKAQQGLPTGHMVGVDAICSGIQIMSCMTGCVAGARNTGLIDPDVRSDAYTACTNEMATILGGAVDVIRDDAKQALMTSFYGSKKTPKDIFGEKTPELDAFYQAAVTIAPGAWELLQDLLASWQPYALVHAWKLPDGFDARVKVMVKQEVRIEVDELDHATFSYEFYENQGKKRGLSNVANVTHSMDAYVLREMHRRCNYQREMVEAAANTIECELIQRSLGQQPSDDYLSHKVEYYRAQWQRSTMSSVVILPYLTVDTVRALATEHLQALASITEQMLGHKPFPIVTVHDEFKAHANNVNQMRWHYKEILAEIADSSVLDDILSQIHGSPGTFDKLSFNLAEQIRESNYALT
jgi:hypothetical protein